MDNIGKLLREMRKQRGLTQERLADEAHVTARTLRSWEKNHQQPRELELESVLNALKATPQEKSEIIGGLKEPRIIRRIQKVESPSEATAVQLADLPGLGDLLCAMRLRRGWTQERLAEAMKVHRISIVRWEATRNLPSQDAVDRLCLLLKASPEEKAALYAGRLKPDHWAPQLTLEECRQQYVLLRNIHDGNNTLMPLTDLYTLSLKRQLYSLLPYSPEALRLLTKVEVHHCWWLYMQDRTAEASAGCLRLLKRASGILAPDNSFSGALNLLSSKAVRGENGEQNALRLLSRWLKMLPEKLHYWLLCDMAFYAGKAQQATTAHHFLHRAQQVRSKVIANEPDKEWHIDWYFRMSTGRVLLSTGKADKALEWLPAMELTGDGRVLSLLVWGEAYLAAGEQNLAARCLTEARGALIALPLPRRQAKLDELARQL